MKVLAKEFHPMRGHVEDGAQVQFGDGRLYTIRARMRGWELLDEKGASVGQAEGAYDLTYLIAGLEKA